MWVSKKIIGLCVSILPSVYAYAEHGAQPIPLNQAPLPHTRQTLPPSSEQSKFNLPPPKQIRPDLFEKHQTNTARAPLDCQNMDTLAGYRDNALAAYFVDLPDYECHYGLFSLSPNQASKIYTQSNFNAVAHRFIQEASIYNADNRALVNLLIYLRAGYYLASNHTIAQPSLPALLRPALIQLIVNPKLFENNSVAHTTASETFKLITNMQDEVYYLSSIKNLLQRYTNTIDHPNAAEALKQPSAAGGFTGVLTVLFYAHNRTEGKLALQDDLSYATLLNNFIIFNKNALLNSDFAYQLTDAANETFRFFRYPGQKAYVKSMLQNLLASTTMTGTDNGLWLAAASAVKYNDKDHCADYGTCDFENKLSNFLFKNNYTCHAALRIRAQQMRSSQMQTACTSLKNEESYFHTMLQTNRKPVTNDRNVSLEVVVFNDYSNYSKYASVLYDIDTNNGGMYLEGNPSIIENQARFIAHEASWMRPSFKIWNLEHEYIHYLDGRFNMFGDFSLSTTKPTVWWIEGIAEYLSKKNDNQESIDIAHTATYQLNQIFGNTYSMGDYQSRAYNWGYMATRFMIERHPHETDSILAKFRVGDYEGYQNTMAYIGTRYDHEFTDWNKTASTAGEPPLPDGPILPLCTSPNYLGKNCTLKGLTASDHAYAYLILPIGAKNVKIWTNGGSGDVDMYIALDRYPTISAYDAASVNNGNKESILLNAPAANRWYYILLHAKQPFEAVSLSATYD